MNEEFEINKRIRELREHLELGRMDFEKRTGIQRQTCQNIELFKQKVLANQLKEICKAWPSFTLWLVTGEADPKNGQTSPEIEKM